MNYVLFLIFALFVVSCGTSEKTKEVRMESANTSTDTVPLKKANMNAKEFISALTDLGFFEHTDPDKVSLVKDSLTHQFNNNGDFLTEFSNMPPYVSYDLRFYSCGDGEELFEEDGVVSLLKEMKPLFEKLKVSMHYSEDSHDGGLHSLRMNGRYYTLFSGGILMQGETIAKTAEMINIELGLQNAKEQIYLLSFDDGYYMVYLTEEQHRLVSTYFTGTRGPITVDQWVTKTTAEMKNLLNR
ncbi:hypothetical protein [Pedobacter sp. SYSU D00535]|uniref:hypothetical protein n=1 Tax=Pedobacter sp. SYSU D00535 TaxID=2810308 RepID=UPI001A975D8B|nr:hypothetical protein [Pedobacter sp. SYSU D00535]